MRAPYRSRNAFLALTHIAVRTASLLLVLAGALQGCSAYDVTGNSSTPAFTLSTSSAPLVLEPGKHASIIVTDTRKAGFTSPIVHSVTSGPVGLSFSIANVGSSDSLTLTATAVAQAIPGIYTIVLQADAAGAARQQLRISLLVTSPVVTNTTPAVSSLAIGAHSCAITLSGAAYCWGSNENGQLGVDDVGGANPSPVAVAGGVFFQSISVSQVEPLSCGFQAGGKAFCWGVNTRGELGDGTITRRLSPTPVVGGLDFRSIAVGNVHVCGITNDGDTYCWGTSPNGALGSTSVETQSTPQRTAVGLKFESVVAGADFTCALTPAGAAYCWGLGVNGQLGDGRSVNSFAPVAVAGGLTFRTIVAGAANVCGLTAAGKAYCWGSNFYGTIGDGKSGIEGGIKRLVPTEVVGGLTFRSLSAGLVTMCGVTESDVAFCWGYNADGDIGDGTFEHRSSPTPVAGGLKFQSVAAGSVRSCGVTKLGAVFCWGDNTDGGLGNGSVALPGSTTPVAVLWQ